MRRGSALIAAVILAVSVLGCEGEDPPAVPAVRDSAGVRLVQHRALSDRRALEVGPALFRVGWAEGDHEFQRVLHGAFSPEGDVVVADIDAVELVVLDADGANLRVLAGRGEGPGELGWVMSVAWAPGDTIIVEDDGNARLSFFDDSSFLRGERTPSNVRPYELRSLGLVDRSLMMTTSYFSPDFDESWLEGWLVRHDPGEGRFDTIASYDIASRRDEIPNPFPPWGAVGIAGNRVLVARGDVARVEVIDATGRLVQILEWEEEAVPLVSGDWTEFERYYEWWNSEQAADRRETALQRARDGAPDVLPLLLDVRGDDLGRIWVSEYSTNFSHPRRYRVFSPDGAWLGWVEIPEWTQILALRGDRMLVVQRDSLNVDAVAVLPLLPR